VEGGASGAAGTFQAPAVLLLKKPGVRYDVVTAAPEHPLGVAGVRLVEVGPPERYSTGVWVGAVVGLA
jgi:hypothetical protein